MEIAILCPNISSNEASRSVILADLANAAGYSPRIVGMELGDRIWGPLNPESLPYEVQSISVNSGHVKAVSQALSKTNTEVVIASKPIFSSMGIGLINKIRGASLIVDFDDRDLFFTHGRQPAFSDYVKDIPNLTSPNSIWYQRFFEYLTPLADFRTATSNNLCSLFNAEKLPQARDCERLDPSRFDKYAIRNRLEIPNDEPLAIFPGTPKPHKGTNILASAANQANVNTMIIGANEQQKANLKSLGGESLIIKGPQPYESIPKLIASADMTIVPTLDTPSARYQAPIKISDSLAMGTPVIGSNVGEIPHLIKNRGIIVQPGEVGELAVAMSDLASDSKKRQMYENNARKYAEKELSIKSLVPKFKSIINSVID